MILSTDPPFIFISINKTGTSSMERALSPWFDEELMRKRVLRIPDIEKSPLLVERLNNSAFNSMPGMKHKPASWAKGNFTYLQPGSDWADFTKFCFVRHPMERLLSIYRFHTQKIHDRYPEAIEAGSFNNWLKIGGTGAARTPMRDFILDSDGRELVDFVGRYENLHSDWAAILRRIGLPKITLPHADRTKTARGGKDDDYDASDVRVFLNNRLWVMDLEYFGYEL